MSGEKDLEQLKREAAEKAKAAALARKQAKESGTAEPKQDAQTAPAESPEDAKKRAVAEAKAKAAALKKAKESGAEAAPAQDDADLAKKKAIAAAKAKAAALKKAKEAGEAGTGEESAGGADDAKAKAAAAAKAKAAAAAKAKAAAQAKSGAGDAGADDEKAIAAAKAKAAAAAKAKGTAAGKEGAAAAPAAEEVKPSPNQPYLDKYRKVIEENLGADILEDSYINNLSKDVPTLVAKKDTYFKLAQFLKYNELLSFDYLSELHGTDFETHMEVYVHLFSYKNRQSVALKVKIDRDEPTIESLQPLWAGADWPECEAYDLLGIKFTGHPDLHRIMLGEDWVGHPLRKDYKPYDVEV